MTTRLVVQKIVVLASGSSFSPSEDGHKTDLSRPGEDQWQTMPDTPDTPVQIASAISSGVKKAEAVLLQRYYRTVLYILRKRVWDEEYARDLCQETFRITIERLRREPLAEPDKLAAFLQRIATNLSIAESRKWERRQTYTDSEYIEEVADPGADQSVGLDRERVASAVRHMLTELENLRDQRILHRYYIDEHNKDEICDELALNRRHFDKVISRARSRFRDLLAASGREVDYDHSLRHHH